MGKATFAEDFYVEEEHVLKGGWRRNSKQEECKAVRLSGDQLDSEALLQVCREPGLALLHLLLGRREKKTA